MTFKNMRTSLFISFNSSAWFQTEGLFSRFDEGKNADRNLNEHKTEGMKKNEKLKRNKNTRIFEVWITERQRLWKEEEKNADPKSFCLKLPSSFFANFTISYLFRWFFKLCTLNNLFVSHAFILSSAVAAVAVRCVSLSNRNVFISCSLLAHTIQAHANNIIKMFLKRYCSNNYFYFIFIFFRLPVSFRQFVSCSHFSVALVGMNSSNLTFLCNFHFGFWFFALSTFETGQLHDCGIEKRKPEREGESGEDNVEWKKKSVFKRLIREQQQQKMLCEYSLCRC